MNKGLFAAFAVSCAAYGAQAGDWNYTVAPDVWGPEFRTSLDMGPNPPVNGDTSIFSILKGSFLIAGEARNGRWSIGCEFNYLNLGDDVSIGLFDNASS